MKVVKETPTLQLCLMCYPYFPSNDTGRGHDRYIFELRRNIVKAFPDIKMNLLQQGFSKGVLVAGIRLFKLVADLLYIKADGYHAISPLGGAAAALLGKSPLIVTIHDLIPFHITGYDYSWKYWYIRFCIKVSVKRCDAIVVPYKVTKEELVSRLNVPGSKIHVVNYGVDHKNYYPRPVDNKSIRRVIYVGEVSRSKGVDALIRAFCIVKQHIADAELVIAGKKSKDQPLLERLSHEMGVQDIIFQGYIPENELPDYYSSATVMIFPSRCGFGLSTLEAMACGTPVIVGDALDAPEFVTDAGILVNPDDIDVMANSIIRVLTEQGLREELSAKAIDRAKAFSWEKMARETVEVYRNVLTKASR